MTMAKQLTNSRLEFLLYDSFYPEKNELINIFKYYQLPMVTLNLIVAILFTVLVIMNKKEIEIRSRQSTFLIHLFVSVVLTALTAFLFG
jgi:hypothetical protein